MRKFQKKQAEDFAELLMQAHDEIRDAIKKNNTVAAMAVLADCQEGAVALGKLIEETEGKDSMVIPLLEEYCEIVYRAYQSLENGKQADNMTDADKIYDILRKPLCDTMDSIKRDIKVRLEIVFLPYKASMWDSMESVWQAARDDDNCDAYVIPIPYYDRKPDGSFGEMHYEIYQYPEDIPVIWYTDYDFEKRRPDIIFIHNPYDGCNYVTSVPPYFYSENLKKFTEQLIYIPYFILGEYEPEDKEGLKKIEHFCTVPGVMNADRVIVQSEKMRKVYIEIMTSYTGKDSRRYWEEKILGLGSPKTDRVLRIKNSGTEIPKEWQKIILREDGSRKKVILYNTSVGALLEHREAMIEKMQYVFRVFKEMREEAALLWRPHPLIMTTIKSMCPQLFEKYRKVMEQYRQEGWGIYDDSSDVDRAIALSDGYYGDPSSLVQLCKKVGMPVMLQNVAYIEE